MKQFNLSSLVLISLIFFCLIPLTIFFLFTQKKVVSELRALEEEQQIHNMKDELGILESKIASYKNMIGFVSQLPAVIEILDKGDELAGSISQKTAYKRYAGVLNRAFQRNNDVISIHILNLNSNVQFSFLKSQETSQYHQVTDTNQNFDPDFLSETLQMKDKNFLISPLLFSDENLSNDKSPLKLLFRIFTPIFLKQKKIGVFCSDIDISILAHSFPEIHWVLNDGSYLILEKRDENAFANFPGLRNIFLADKAGVWRNDGTMMAWMPVFKGKDVSLALWAGKEIALRTVQDTIQKMHIEIFKVFLVLLALFFLISFWLSKYTKRVSAKFFDDLRQSIFNQQKVFPGSKKRIREFSDFSENIAYILDQNTNLEKQRQQTLTELKKALDEIKTLRGILPLCSFCKKIRDDRGYWEQVDVYICKNFDADISHSICPDCMKKHYPEEYEAIESDKNME